MTDVTEDPPPNLLSYQFATAPSPLQVSGTAAASPGMVNVWISPPDGQVIYSNQIVVSVPVGTKPTDFSTVAPTLTPSTTRWVSSAAVMMSGQDAGLDPALNYAIFTVTCPAPDYWKIDYQLVFSVVTTSVSPHPERFPFVVSEFSGTDPDDLTLHKTTFKLLKGPIELYLSNLLTFSAAPSEPADPRTEFRHGEPIRLAWESNGERYSVYQAGRPGPIWTGIDTSHTIAGGVANTTTFTVLAMMDDGAGAASASTAAATTSVATTVTVSNPALTPATDTAGALTVVDATTLTGAAGLGQTTAEQGLTVTEVSRLAGVTAPSVTASGPAALASATMGNSTAGAITGGGTLNLNSATSTAATVTGTGTALVHRTLATGQNYTASSDGILIGTVSFGDPAGAQIATRISGTVSGIGTAYATGGNTCPWMSSKEFTMWGDPDTFVLPVPKGATFSVAIANRFGGGAPTAFAWYPLARNATLTEASTPEAGPPPPPLPGPVTTPRPSLRRQVDRVIALFAEIVGDTFTPELRRRTFSALETLVGGGPPAPEEGTHEEGTR